MLENEKKSKRERERERKVAFAIEDHKSRGIGRAEKWEEVVSGRPWSLYEEHFTHTEHPNCVMIGCHISATKRKERWEEKEKTKVAPEEKHHVIPEKQK